MIDLWQVPSELLDQPIRPWSPHRGERVRVTASIAECRASGQLEANDGRVWPIIGHDDQEAGRTGVVVKIEDTSGRHIHDYLVLYDQRYERAWLVVRQWHIGGWYSAWELEPLG